MFVSYAIVGFLALGGVACDDALDPSSNEVAQVLIFSLDETIPVGGIATYEGRAATFAAVRVDSLVTWSLSNTGIATMTAQMVTNENGRRVNLATLTGVAPGQVDLIASAGSESYTLRITVFKLGF